MLDLVFVLGGNHLGRSSEREGEGGGGGKRKEGVRLGKKLCGPNKRCVVPAIGAY